MINEKVEEKVISEQPALEEASAAAEQVETVSEEGKAAPVANENAKNNNQRGERRPFNKDGNNQNRRFNNNNRRRPAPGREVKEYAEVVVGINRVTKVVKGGKNMKFSALVAIGDRKGKYGFAMGKAGEVPDAIKKAVEKAKKNMYTISLVKSGTIPHEVVGQFGATKVYLKPANEGTGIVAGGAVRNVLELAGVRNVYSKVYGSRTKVNVVKATDAALRSLKSYTKVNELRK